MELKVGDYARTKRGQIYKITDLKGYYENEQLIVEKQIVYINNKCSGWNYAQFNELIIKSSPNIIDLTKNEDLLKIIYPIGKNKDLFQEEITQVIENEDNKLYIKLYTEKYVFLEDFSKYDIEIKSIITKEQFEQMEYRIGEDE